MIKIATTILILASMPQAFEYQHSSPDALFPQQKAISETTLPGGISNPALLPHLDMVYLNLSASRPYGLSELKSTNMSVGYSSHSFGMQAHWSQFGIKEYQEQQLATNFGFSFFNIVSIGASVRYYNLTINSGEVDISKNLLDAGCGLLFSPIKYIQLAFMQDNVYALSQQERQDLLDPRRSLGIGLFPVKGLFLAWNLYNDHYGYINSFEVSINILKSFAVKAGYARETATYAAGCILNYKHITFSYGFRFHPLLGNTHAAGLTLSMDYLKPVSISYQTTRAQKRLTAISKKININTCSYAELTTIPGLEETYAKRIFNYRKLFGELSRTALSQVGLNPVQIKNILPSIYGLAPEKTFNKTGKQRTSTFARYKNQKRIQDHIQQRKKLIFMELLQQGLSANQAIAITELAMQQNSAKLRATIAALSVPETTKEKIRAICGK